MGNGIGGRGETKCCGDPSNVCCIKGGAVGVVHTMWQDTKVLTKVLQPMLVVFEFVERERRSLQMGKGQRKSQGQNSRLKYWLKARTLQLGIKQSATDLRHPKNGAFIAKIGNHQSGLYQ